MAQPRFIILDPGMDGLLNHNARINQALALAARRRGMTPLVCINQALRRSSAGVFLPFYRVSNFNDESHRSADEWLQRRQIADGAFYDDTRNLFDLLRLQPDDEILIHTLTTFNCVALSHLLFGLGEQGPRVHVNLMFEPAYGTANHPDLIEYADAMWRDALARMVPLPNLRWSAESATLIDYYHLRGTPEPRLALLPQELPAPRQPGDDAEPVLLFAGGLRHEKGVVQMLGAVPSVHARHPQLRFRIAMGAEHAEVARLVAETGPGVTMIPGADNDEVYFNAMRGATYGFCFYDPTRYRYRNSNVFWELLAMGVVPLVTSGLACVATARRLGITSFIEIPAYDAAALIQTIDDHVIGHRIDHDALARDGALARRLKMPDESVFLAGAGGAAPTAHP